MMETKRYKLKKICFTKYNTSANNKKKSINKRGIYPSRFNRILKLNKKLLQQIHTYKIQIKSLNIDLEMAKQDLNKKQLT